MYFPTRVGECGTTAAPLIRHEPYGSIHTHPSIPSAFFLSRDISRIVNFRTVP